VSSGLQEMIYLAESSRLFVPLNRYEPRRASAGKARPITRNSIAAPKHSCWSKPQPPGRQLARLQEQTAPYGSARPLRKAACPTRPRRFRARRFRACANAGEFEVTMRRRRLQRLATRRRVAQRFRLLWAVPALSGDGTTKAVARSIEWAYDEVQRQLPRSAATLLPYEVSRLVDDSVEFAAQMSLMNLDVQRPAALEHDTAQAHHWAEEVRAGWGAAIDDLRLLRWVAYEEGRDFHSECPSPGLLREVLVRLHARAITVTDEVLCLLSSGFTSGALARWRTLHELAVTAAFVGKHGERTAERFLAQHTVTRHKQGVEYTRQANALGERPLSDSELAANKEAHDAAVARFGSALKHDYGWAAHVLGKERPTFRDLETDVSHGHLRPYYQYASSRVHAGAHGLLQEVAAGDPQALLVGAYPRGLTDPLQLTALSLRGVTAELLLSGPAGPGLRQRIVLEVLNSLYQRLGERLPETRRTAGHVAATISGASSAVGRATNAAEDGERPLAAWPPLGQEAVNKVLRRALRQLRVRGGARGGQLAAARPARRRRF
jgi:hypothetical protein